MPEVSVQSATERALLKTLGELGGQRVQEDDLIFEGRQLVIPETMTAHDAVQYLSQHIQQQEQETRFQRTFRYRPWDGAHALQSALKKVFGQSGIGQRTVSFFGSTPPEMRTINTGPGTTAQVPWGQLSVPFFKGQMYLAAQEDPELGQLFHLVVDAPRKYRAQIEGLFLVIEEELASNSIYRSKAFDGSADPEFLDLSGVDKAKVVYSDDVMEHLTANVFSLLQHGEVMRDMGIPLKRAVLLEGPYGTGKTLAAFLTAQQAIENGWAFLYCRPGKDDLDAVLQTARLYQPAVVFFEDVDVVAEEHDPQAISKLLDMFDGITAKGTELMVILTTNHVDRIHKGMVRPGRLDAVVHIGALDRHGVEKLVKASVTPEFLGELDYDAVYEAMEGFLPAFVKEAVDRTVRYAIARNGGEPGVLETADFIGAANGLRPQLELMDGAGEGKKPDSVGKALERTISNVIHETVDATQVLVPGLDDGRLIVQNGKS